MSAPPPDRGASPPDRGASPPDRGASPSDRGAPPSDRGTLPPDRGTLPPESNAPPPGEGAPERGSPPRLARRLLAGGFFGRSPLGSGSSESERVEVLDSLAELYVIRRQTRGRARADLWYWWQAISFPAHASRRRFGRRRGRHERTPTGMLSDWMKDVRSAARGLAANPGFTAVAVLALGLGIGSLTPTFSLINAYLLRPLPFDEPDRLVHLWETAPRQGFFTSRVSWPNYRDWRERSASFEDMAAFNYTSETLTGGDQPQRISSGRVSANVFDVLGVAAAHGRGFRAGEDRPGNTGVVVLSHGYWQRDFGGDPGVLGQGLELNGERHTIVGVMPPEFVFPLVTTEIWLPWALDEASRPRNVRFLQVVGRLAEGVTMPEAQAEMDAIARTLREEFPEANADAGVRVVDLRSALNFAYEILQVMSAILLVAGSFVLLIACANVSGLLLACAFGRSREVAIRTALGASRAQLVRQFLTESLLLAAAGGALGVLLAYWLVGTAATVIPADLYRVGEIDIDAAALSFTLVVTMITVLIFGLVPALRASSLRLTGALEGGKGTTSSRGGLRLRRFLVAGQVALALVLLIGTATMIRALGDMRDADTGFDTSGVMTMLVVLDTELYPQTGQVLNFHARVVEELSSAPGVVAAATVNHLPLNHEVETRPFTIAGAEVPPDAELPMAITLHVSSGYFRAMGVPVLAGRAFDTRDTPDTMRVALINDVFAERHWPDADPVGERILLEDTPVQIVGVVADTKHADLGEIDEKVYLPISQNARRYFRIVARIEGDAVRATGAIRRAIWNVDPDLPITEVRSLEQVIADFLLPQRMLSAILGGLSVGAILLAAVGIYGLFAFIVSQSTREMSIRIALGATGRAVMAHVLKDGLRMAMAGAAVGLVGAVMVTRLMAACRRSRPT
jgi:putative ABC transport system permease protein